MSIKLENEWKISLHDNCEFTKGIDNMSKEELDILLDEKVNMPIDFNGNRKIYKDNHFHCSYKGCNVEMRIVRTMPYGNISTVKYCITHDKLCSKSGWEMGWFNGIQADRKSNSNGLQKYYRTLEVVKSKIYEQKNI